MIGPGRSSFAPAFWLLAPPERVALSSLFRFCRAADEAVDSAGGDAERAARDLDRWRAEVAALYGAGEPATREGRALAAHVARYGMARADFERLLDALALDVTGPRLETEADLAAYCEGVASSPGYLALGIFGCPEARPYAHRLGLALQLVNVLRDARDDLTEGRIYFPREDLRRTGVAPEQLVADARARAPAAPAAAALVGLSRDRAHAWFAEAERAYRAQSAAARRRLVTARAMERLYRRLLGALEAAEPLPRRRPRLGALGAAGAVAGAWFEGSRQRG